MKDFQSLARSLASRTGLTRRRHRLKLPRLRFMEHVSRT